MAINIITYPGVVREAVYDAMAFDAIVGASGILYGCTVSKDSNNVFKVDTGYGIIKGRLFNIDAPVILTVANSDDDTNVYGKIWLELNLAGGSPIEIKASTTYTASIDDIELTTNPNINFVGGGAHQVKLANFKMSTSGIAEFTQTMGGTTTIGSGVIESIMETVNRSRKKYFAMTPSSSLSQRGPQYCLYNNHELYIHIDFVARTTITSGTTILTGFLKDVEDILDPAVDHHTAFIHRVDANSETLPLELKNQKVNVGGEGCKSGGHYVCDMLLPLIGGI